jgi:hypothetical protein
MSNYAGYYVKIGDCDFTNPAPKREGLLIQPHLVQTADSGVLASGALEIKVLPHTRTKIQMDFPVMTKAQYEVYYNVIMSSMYLEVEYYNEGIDEYETGIFYHNDMQYKPVIYNGQRMIEMQEIHLIEH